MTDFVAARQDTGRARQRHRALWWAAGLALLFAASWGFVRRSAWLGLWGLTNDLDGVSPFYDGAMPGVTFAMFFHMVTGAGLTVLAPLQLVGPLRRRWPRLHRHGGRVMVGLGLVTALGGLGYALRHGTTGGPFMDASTSLYGLMVLAAALQTLRFGMARAWARHRRWGLRFSVLVIASWLYRMHYMLWEHAFGTLWITPDMTGPFDKVQAWGFYLFYAALLELWFVFGEGRGRGRGAAG